MCENVVLAAYHCRYNPRDGKISDLRDGVFYSTRFTSFQGELIPCNPQDSLVLFRPQSQMRQARLPVPVQQLWLLEQADTA